jgi:hypothetical protein
MTRSGSTSLISMIARSARFGTKYGEPQCRSEKCAMRNSGASQSSVGEV